MPVSVVNKLNSIMAGFLWGDSADQRKTHWANWNLICQPLESGGLNVRNIVVHNRAMLGKWAWKFANDRDGLWKKVICSKYDINPSSLDIGDKPHRLASWQWRGVLNSAGAADGVGEIL
ncbi:hypothetical protein like AT4G29090 [Hibiscus trionum]|uniref:Reverse transcriptase zinc-binding domain-containing protein n=1 Tax=Hibiscus trionum TaxID=183268 RepID=A0A9W7MB49_HIBTR|nr:hypothetical protein like AT4G29090 [Hibiscus trionum]